MNRINVSKNSKILVALSGGVDSSVAAGLLKQAGYRVEGAYMRCYSQGPYCTADKDQADAAKVAASLGIPFHVFNFEKEYAKAVIHYFLNEYKRGRTPNPDVMCNKEIKFGLFLQKALELGFDYIATGHYARVYNSKFRIKNGEKVPTYSLLTGKDSNKDQSYFLYLLTQENLAQTVFPLGDFTKKQVRSIAKKWRLPTANKPDSTGICFIGPVDVREFLMQKIKTNHGDIINLDGKLLGSHVGLPFYTIGQRGGLGIASSIPHYVVDKDIPSNTLIVAPFGHRAMFKKIFLASEPNWIAGEAPDHPLKASVKLRYRSENIPAVIEIGEEGLLVTLDSPQRAITPGQSAVFYEGDKVLGGSVVEEVLN